MSDPAAPPAPARIGRYRIERKIGEGGMGVVYAAHDERLDRTVALKAIRGDSDETARRRLWREARIAAGISHPNICQLYEVEETDDGLFLAMELLAGESLGARLARGALAAADASAIALQTLDALEALHTRGLIHRDLKPSNLFLTPHGVKLLDFGLARPMAGALSNDTATLLTQAGAIVGTPNYMAPEQVRGEALDGRADLFAMAALLFEMLSGRVAFGGATMVDILHAVLHEQPPALSGGSGVVGLDRVVHKALQKKAADRYGSAVLMAEAIRGVVVARESAELAAPAARPMTRLIALPFRVLRPDAETDFLAFSLPDAITTSLTGTRNLLVRSSAAAARFDPQAPDLRRLAADADVDLALMGTILRAGTQLRATAQLVEAPAGTVVWSHSAQHPLHDVFALQDELVGAHRRLAVAIAGRARQPRRPPRRAAQRRRLRALPARQPAGARLGSHRRGARRLPALHRARLGVRAGVGRSRPLPPRARQVLRRRRRRGRRRAGIPARPEPQSRPAAPPQVLRAARVRCRTRRRRDAAAAAAGRSRRSIPSTSPGWSTPAATPACSTRRWRRTTRLDGSTRPSRPACSIPTPRSATTSGSCANPRPAIPTAAPWRSTASAARPKPWRPGRASGRRRRRCSRPGTR